MPVLDLHGAQLIEHPGSRWAAEHTGGCSMGFSFPIQIFGWNVTELKPSLQAGLRQTLLGCGGGKCSEVINAAQPCQNRLYESGWSCHRKQHREVVEPARLDLFQWKFAVLGQE